MFSEHRGDAGSVKQIGTIGKVWWNLRSLDNHKSDSSWLSPNIDLSFFWHFYKCQSFQKPTTCIVLIFQWQHLCCCTAIVCCEVGMQLCSFICWCLNLLVIYCLKFAVLCTHQPSAQVSCYLVPCFTWFFAATTLRHWWGWWFIGITF